MKSRSLEAVYSAEEISRRVGELGEEISRDYEGQVPILVSILKGSIVFLADLMRSITIPVHLDFMSITSCPGNRKLGGVVRILKDIDLPVSSRPVIIVEDIIDTGLTAGYLVKSIQARDPQSLQICTLLDRQVRRLARLPLRYVGFEIPDQFLVGYGLDHRETWRNLPYLARLPEDETSG
jgi:hypoxanthine phosphoribosyltransferase